MRTQDRQRNVAAGLCRDCMSTAAKPGSYCEYHYEKLVERKARYQKNLMNNGLCVECGQRAIEGQLRCETHAELCRQRARASYLKKKAAKDAGK